MSRSGFTENKGDYDRVIAFRQAMLADGWTMKPTYPGQETEETASTLGVAGWEARVLVRQNIGKWPYEALIAIWGPDNLAITVPETYSMDGLIAALRICCYCGKTDVPTQRISFAGRCCAACRFLLVPRLEGPGWTN